MPYKADHSTGDRTPVGGGTSGNRGNSGNDGRSGGGGSRISGPASEVAIEHIAKTGGALTRDHAPVPGKSNAEHREDLVRQTMARMGVSRATAAALVDATIALAKVEVTATIGRTVPIAPGVSGYVGTGITTIGGPISPVTQIGGTVSTAVGPVQGQVTEMTTMGPSIPG